MRRQRGAERRQAHLEKRLAVPGRNHDRYGLRETRSRGGRSIGCRERSRPKGIVTRHRRGTCISVRRRARTAPERDPQIGGGEGERHDDGERHSEDDDDRDQNRPGKTARQAEEEAEKRQHVASEPAGDGRRLGAQERIVELRNAAAGAVEIVTEDGDLGADPCELHR